MGRDSTPRAAQLRLAFAACMMAVALPACAGSSVMVGGPGVGIGFPTRRAEVFGDTVADRLYFGRGIPGGGAVADSAWGAFLGEVVTPRFPAGLTVYRVEGQWRNDDRTIGREQSFVLEIVHPAGPAADADLREIADEYKRRFRQEAVLRVTEPVHLRIYEE
jgi:Protein of unknown function (DUF3574)